MSYYDVGGSSGGFMKFVLGLMMAFVGLYLLLDNVRVGNWGGSMFSIGGFDVTTGYILVPIIFGIGMLFYNSKNPFGWFLAGGGMAAMLFGILTSVHFRFDQLSAFSLMVILVLLFGGVGLFLSSFREQR